MGFKFCYATFFCLNVVVVIVYFSYWVSPWRRVSGSSGGSNEQSGADAAVANVKILLKCPSGERRTINVTESCTLHVRYATLKLFCRAVLLEYIRYAYT